MGSNRKHAPSPAASPKTVARRTGAVTQKPSRYGRRRACVLASVYLLMGLHVAHWKITGKTLAPLELNEVMVTLELGIVTAGFLFMSVAFLSAAIFGRFFCSWGCHILALEDLCAWLLGRLRIRPRPIRSRLLLLVPPGAMSYMFLWPQVSRLLAGRAPPELRLLTDQDGWASFVTADFWRNLPDPYIALLTFAICGFAIVYVLGSRSFCRYACPYGVLFGLADRIAPGRIVAKKTCLQCGHCTAVCQSQVRVHEEIARFGNIVDPACLKDLDCISACPNEVLGFGFTRPSLGRSFRGKRRRSVRFEYTLAEEILMALTFVATMLVFRGLYGVVPFLMTLGLGGIAAVLAVLGTRMVRQPAVRLVPFQLKLDGKTTRAGMVFLTAAFGGSVLFAHSAFIRYHEHFGDRALAAAMRHGSGPGVASEATLRAEALGHLQARERWGLFRPLDLDLKLASVLLAGESPALAEPYLLRVLERRPGDVRSSDAHFAMAELLAKTGDFVGAVRQYELGLEIRPDSPAALYNLGTILAATGRPDEAVAKLRAALVHAPADAQVHNNLGFLLARQGDTAGAERHFRLAITHQPAFADPRFNLGRLLLEQGREEEALRHLRRAAQQDPRYAQYLGAIGPGSDMRQ